MTVDPVCGSQVRERTAQAATFYRGRIYYFCSKAHKEQFETDPDRYAETAANAALKVGVMGAASGELPASVREKAYRLGEAIAAQEMVLVTGAAPGLPWECARGVQAGGGLSVGISPALSLYEHIEVYDSPADAFDVLIYTGSGLMGREVVNIRSSDLVVIIGGHSGTLGEFAIAYDEGKLIGIVEGSGGIADVIPEIVLAIDKETGARLLYDEDPDGLIRRLIDVYVEGHFQRPSVFVGNTGRERRTSG